MANILVTGANGFIGQHLIARLVREGHFVRAMVRSEVKGANLRQDQVELHIGDLSVLQTAKNAVEDMDGIINCAAKVSDWGAKEEFERANIATVANLISVISSTDNEIHLIHLSTSDVYGFPNARIDETYMPRFMGINYIDTKIKAEQLLQAASASNPAITIIRPTNVIGPNSTSYVDELLEAASSLKFIPDIAKPDAYGGFLCVENLIEAIIITFRNAKAFREIFNVCDEIPVRWTQYIHDLSSLASMRLPIVKLPFGLIHRMAVAAEAVGELYGREKRPPLTKLSTLIIGTEQNFSAERIRRILHFSPVTDYRTTMDGIGRSLN